MHSNDSFRSKCFTLFSFPFLSFAFFLRARGACSLEASFLVSSLPVITTRMRAIARGGKE